MVVHYSLAYISTLSISFCMVMVLRDNEEEHNTGNQIMVGEQS
jgi:hypothetical protein